MEIVFLFYEEMTALDAIGPYEVLSRLPGAHVSYVAEKKGAVHTHAKLSLVANKSLSEVTFADILCVPGGRRGTSLKDHPQTLDWLRNIHKTTTWTTSVCTGSLILGAAGLLKGLPATTHWAAMDRLTDWGAIPTKERVVESGKIMTAAGVSAGIDMGLRLAEKIAGRELAESLQLGLEYDPKPPFDKGSPEKAKPAILEALKRRLDNQFES